ncbi:branched-chain amino acid ABC transporter permease [Arthrobacter sp. zg-Y820]|uniref:branched-chain amino acid ABC transporter permease n=1 Tax=unclassified Arthrobacter TaxID=235627 RepID=UPI001E3BD4B5|nr:MULTISPECIES: branched-chain amino acid ABC transporter permease [unclassified Arthrobacter]MCC9196068.1 branched-chain amino acid ABC transporter permease [Arthrobacter sp. zg-Y820]MDK1278927.1 branched-chain amino acid ABC transporter permease [Arthrobacter sp. zg.Y820]WIB08659.1 branched-chain amino acid ABC transporter permease [Arthrobacter sp. zg-Y820]
MDRFLFLTVDGLARGAVLAAFALSLVIIWRAARIVNFAQGAMAVATTYVAFTVTSATGSYWLGLASAVVAGLVLGALVERTVMRFVGNTSPLNSVIAGLGLLLVIQAVLGMIFGNGYKSMATPFSTSPISLGGVSAVSPYDLFIFACIAAIMAGLALLFTRTSLGLRLRAAAFAPELARLLGVRSSRMLTLGWALSSAVGALAALLIIPTELGLNPHAVDTVFVYAFTVAVVGGLDSAGGAVAGGLAVGVVLSWVSGYLGATLAPIAVLVLLLAVLLLRPAGLFSMTKERTV